MMYGIYQNVGQNGQTKQIGCKAIFCLEFAPKLDLLKFIYLCYRERVSFTNSEGQDEMLHNA